jgi:FkbM family methyltransferase
MESLSRLFIREVLRRAHEYHPDNWDSLRFGPNPAANIAGQYVIDIERGTDAFLDLLNHMTQYEWLHNTLADDVSRRWLVDLLVYRVHGHAHVKLPLNTEAFWREYRSIDARFAQQLQVDRSGAFSLNLYFFPFRGQELRVVTHPLAILMLIVGQYFLERNGVRIQPEAGDVVIDGGGCWGEAALAFAASVGERGHVYCFEFVPNNLRILRDNLVRCATLAPRVTVIEKALANESKQSLSFADRGPASTLTPQMPGGNCVETLTIDDLVARENLARVDFIKMDIEGAEMAAVQGARHTIQRFQPKLAISVYHRAHDLFDLPWLIQQIHGRYEFFLDHHTIHLEETVLYARVR